MVKSGVSILIVALWAAVVASQATGTISGTVRRDAGAPLARVTVTVTNVDTGIARTVITDEQGRYQAANLGAGTYQVRAELPGFQAQAKAGIEVAAGRAAGCRPDSLA